MGSRLNSAFGWTGTTKQAIWLCVWSGNRNARKLPTLMTANADANSQKRVRRVEMQKIIRWLGGVGPRHMCVGDAAVSPHRAVKTTNRTSSAARVPFMFYMLLNEWVFTIGRGSMTCNLYLMASGRVCAVRCVHAEPHSYTSASACVYCFFFIQFNSKINIMWACLNACMRVFIGCSAEWAQATERFFLLTIIYYMDKSTHFERWADELDGVLMCIWLIWFDLELMPRD